MRQREMAARKDSSSCVTALGKLFDGVEQAAASYVHNDRTRDAWGKRV